MGISIVACRECGPGVASRGHAFALRSVLPLVAAQIVLSYGGPLSAAELQVGAAAPATTAIAQPDPANDGHCNDIRVTIAATTLPLDTAANQNKVIQEVTDELLKVTDTPPNYQLQHIGLELARASFNVEAATSGQLQRQLDTALMVACSDLVSNEYPHRPAQVLQDALYQGGFPPLNPNQYTLYLGSVSSLQASGGFTTSLEASFIARSVFSGQRPLGIPDEHEGWLTNGVFELTYAKIAALQSPSSGSGTPAATSSSTNPFTSASGILRANLSIERLGLLHQFLGFTGGVGFTSRTGTTQATYARLSPRGFVGLELLADYGSSVSNENHATGRVIIAYAHDRFWTPYNSSDTTTANQPNRIVVDARLDTPGVLKNKTVKISFQVFADAPTASHGPADVRFSLLVSTNLQSLIPGGS